MTAVSPPMDVLNDIHFLRQDNANLLKEVMSLRQQSALLRNRSDDLERKLRSCVVSATTVRHTQQPQPRVLDLTTNRKEKLKLEIPGIHDTQEAVPGVAPEPEAVWFDDPTTAKASSQRFAISGIPHAASGSQLIGEAPRATTTEQRVEEQSLHRPSTITPPSPDPSERQSRITIPSLVSVNAPVQGVAVPNVASSLLELRLIRKETHDTPAAVASFLQKLTQTNHTPQPTYRAAFTAAFLTLIPLLGPPGTLSTEWLNFLHDFPSRIPHSQRDSIVSIPWPTSYISHQHHDDINPTLLHPPLPLHPPLQSLSPPSKPSSNSNRSRRRSRSLDGLVYRTIPIPIPPTGRLPDVPPPPPRRTENTSKNANANANENNANGVPHAPTPTPAPAPAPPPTGVVPTGERDAWVLLLALAFAAFPSSRVATKLRKLPITVKLQMIAWLPPGVNVYANLHFACTTVDEALTQFWDAKKEILRLKHGWP